MTLLGDLTDREQLTGRGQVRITDSDLRGTDILGPLYDLMSLGANDLGPQGHGTARFSLEQSNLSIPTFRYLNQGTEVRAELRMVDNWQSPNCVIEGTAFGSL